MRGHDALDKYRRLAPAYDRGVEDSSRELREAAIDRLRLRPGDVVLDVGCGTGLSFEPLVRRIGPEGSVIAIDVSPDMLARARARAERTACPNVTLIESSAEEARIPLEADAALFFLTNDVMRAPAALENALTGLRPGARVSAAGAKWAAHWWAAPLNLARRLDAGRYATTFDGRKRPWDLLERLVPDLQVEATPLGRTYLAWGTWQPATVRR